MKKYFVVIILLVGFNVILQSQNKEHEKHSYSDFEKELNPNMGHDSIVTRFGNPKTTTGSGLHILIYELVDSTSLTIGCTNINIIYAKHYDRNGNMIHELFNKSGYTNQPHKKKVKKPKHNRSVYAIAYPAIVIKNKKDSLNLAGLAPAERLGTPTGRHGFCTSR